MCSYIFNITEIEREQAKPLKLEFYGGDILSEYSDVLLLSAFRNDYKPFEGTIFHKLKEKFGISYNNELPAGHIKITDRLYDFNSTQTSAFKKLWILEIADSRSNKNQHNNTFKAFRSLEDAIIRIEECEVSSISLPLIGTGAQGISKEKATSELINVIKKWSQKSENLDTVKIFAYDLEAAAILNQTIDAHFGVSQENVTDYSQKLLTAIKEELVIKIKLINKEISDNLNDIYNLINMSYPSVKSIAVAGRILAEKCTELLINKWYPEEDIRYKDLHNRIFMITNDINKSVTPKPWIISYLRLLQISGNFGAHNSKKLLNLTDAAAVIIAALRVAEYTNDVITKN
jgi:O-acetyl-ADP-ribose deacetylase (regulator of RNase III)